ncbi:hypothetical protein [Persephonella sp.]|uniref:hypothetical protein n=1 Tax=Persephonella sp. TaxID=2060922 RepID=UPI002603D1D1|nr:hypothetical protein [Persephonella sp.]
MKRIFISIFLYTLFLGGFISVVTGYYFLNIDQIYLYKKLIPKDKTVSIVLYDGKHFSGKIKAVKKEDGKVVLIVDGQEIPVEKIRFIDKTDINSIVINQLSRNGTIGIILAGFGGFFMILSILLKDYL